MDTIRTSSLARFGEARISPPRTCVSPQTQNLRSCALTTLVLSKGHHPSPPEKKDSLFKTFETYIFTLPLNNPIAIVMLKTPGNPALKKKKVT